MLPARIGCAGWSIPGHHAQLFGEGPSRLARYATRFDAVEINSSFYRAHRRETYARWAASVPAGFRFAVKVPRQVTHDHRLQGSGALLDAFLGECGGLQRKLAGLLVQLPPSLAFDARIASTFLSVLRRRTAVPIALEPRHPGWFDERATGLLRRHDVARVAADPALIATAAEPLSSSAWQYWRWHGSPRMYYSAYGDAAIVRLGQRMREAPRSGVRSWVVFDNTAHGHAVADAARLQAVVGPAARGGRRA